jgi:hypothetical protein
MKLLFASILLLLFITTVKPEEEANQEIKIEQIQFSRILPHAYCDQGKSSVKGMFPDSELITFKRFAYLADRPYCLIAYRENKEIDEIKISGVFLVDMNAYHFETITIGKEYGSTLLKTAEQITNFKIQR